MKKTILFLCTTVIFILAFAGTAYANTIRVGLTRSFANRNSISIATTSIDIGRGTPGFTFNRTLTSANGFTVTVDGGQLVIRSGGANGPIQFTFLNGVDGGPQIRATTGNLTLGSYAYRGIMEFRLSGGRITAINVICLEEYLYGVVPVEMSHSFYTEALRAQAVAARTFAMHTAGRSRHPGTGFNICDTTCCQAYRAVSREHPLTTQAVRDTRGLMIFAPGGTTPLFTPYFSSSGGSTDNNENVWVDNLPHLRGVWDPYEQNPRIWTRTYTWAQLTNAINTESNAPNIGTVTGLSISSMHLGRVQELTFTGTTGSWTATRQQTLSIFRHIDRSLYSRHFTLAGSAAAATNTYISSNTATVQRPTANLYIMDNAGQIVRANPTHVFDGTAVTQLGAGIQTLTSATSPAGVTINGRGWGHGVGMSQHGANGMAQAGYDFRTILLHYYTGVEIR